MQAEWLDSDRLSIQCSLDSTAEAVRGALGDIGTHLNTLAPCQGQDTTWELVVAEVLNNIVEHAYQEQPGGEIRVELVFSTGAMQAQFTDFGRPMPNETPPEGKEADLDVPTEDLPEGGFGWFLIRSLSTRLDYERRNDANRLCLEIPLGCQA